MKKVILLIAFFILCILTLNQCNKCKSKRLDDIRFTSKDLNIVPYNGSETLCFKDSIGDSILYCSNGNGRINTLNHTYVGRYEQKDDCPPEEYYYIEKDETTFYRVNSQNRIEVILSFYSPASDVIKKQIKFIVVYEDSKYWAFGGTFEFDALKLYNINTTQSEVLTFNDSIFIGPIKRYNVYTLVQNENPVNAQKIKTLYYTVDKGIIGFKTDTDLLWYLKN